MSSHPTVSSGSQSTATFPADRALQHGALALELLEPAIDGRDELELAVDLCATTAALAAAAVPGHGALLG